ncbi:MAG: HNH endonuclease [Blastocatellia bacterium]
MWHWDQGHLPYFQFDALRQIASFVEENDFKLAERDELYAATGLRFAGPSTHNPWRQYSRVLKRCLLVSEVNGVAWPTPVARLLSQPGVVTCDEYFHFIVRCFTEPSPASANWRYNAAFRYPLLFALKYVLTKVSINQGNVATLDEIIGAYRISEFLGSETDEDFIGVVNNNTDYETAGQNATDNLRRQARESLKVIAQISYLHTSGNNMFASLNAADAREIFHDLTPVLGPHASDRDTEIQRLAGLFQDGFTDISFDYPHTVIEDVVESGFQEGNKVKKTHLTIERNSGLRREFFLLRPTSVCDVCSLNTANTYPWTERIIDLHHLLPLSSGTRVEVTGTTLRPSTRMSKLPSRSSSLLRQLAAYQTTKRLC